MGWPFPQAHTTAMTRRAFPRERAAAIRRAIWGRAPPAWGAAAAKEFRTLTEVTFVFTDLEGSTAMSLADADAYRQVAPRT